MTEFKIRFSFLNHDNHSEALSIERLSPLLSSDFFNELIRCEQQLLHQAATSIVENELTDSHLDSSSISVKVDISKSQKS